MYKKELITQIEKKILKVHHGVDLSLFYPQENKKENDVFTFLSSGGWANGLNDRKGTQFLMKAFSEEFSKDEPVRLLVKINTVYCQPGWNLDNEIQKLELKPDGGQIQIGLENADYNKLRELYYFGDVFVCPTMGEAFGLPMVEAMACGIPVITTNFGGQTDFVNPENGWLVDYELIENTTDTMYEGCSWAKVNLESLRKTLREAYNNKPSVKEKGCKAILKAKNLTWDNSVQTILDSIKPL